MEYGAFMIVEYFYLLYTPGVWSVMFQSYRTGIVCPIKKCGTVCSIRIHLLIVV